MSSKSERVPTHQDRPRALKPASEFSAANGARLWRGWVLEKARMRYLKYKGVKVVLVWHLAEKLHATSVPTGPSQQLHVWRRLGDQAKPGLRSVTVFWKVLIFSANNLPNIHIIRLNVGFLCLSYFLIVKFIFKFSSCNSWEGGSMYFPCINNLINDLVPSLCLWRITVVNCCGTASSWMMAERRSVLPLPASVQSRHQWRFLDWTSVQWPPVGRLRRLL